MQTSNLQIKLLYSHQAQKELSINEALIKIDSILNAGAISMNVNVPPTPPKTGDLYIIGNLPQDIWKDYPQHITYYYVNQWYFIAPKIGSMIWVNNQKNIFYYDEGQWNSYTR